MKLRSVSREFACHVVAATLVFASTVRTHGQDCCAIDADGIDADSPQAAESFGHSISRDGDLLVAGPPTFDDGATDNVGRAVVFENNDPWEEVQELTNANGAEDDEFGWSVGLSGDTAVVGAHLEDSPNDDEGAAYVFIEGDPNWSQQARLVAENPEEGDCFGFSVAISGDTIVIGAPATFATGTDSGRAFVFERSGTTWTRTASLSPSDDPDNAAFGWSVAINEDEDEIVIGAPNVGNDQGALYVYEKVGTSWTNEVIRDDDFGDSGDELGSSVAISGDIIVGGAITAETENGGAQVGSAYVFRFENNQWTEDEELFSCDEGTDFFGGSVAVSTANRDIIVVGERMDGPSTRGAAHVYRFDGARWVHLNRLEAQTPGDFDAFGRSVAVTGDDVFVGAPGHDSHGEFFSFTGFASGGSCDCPEDVDGSDVVDFTDLLLVLSAWGTCSDCPEDVDGDGEVDFGDVLDILSAWGPCPQSGAAEPESFADELDCRDIDHDTCWEGQDKLEDMLENGTVAEQDDAICWIQHYDSCHCPDTCVSAPTNCGDDPCGIH